MSGTEFSQRYGPWAVVAGASEGLGLAFAESIARRGVHVLLVARRAAVLNDAAESLQERYGVEADALSLDLSEPDCAERIIEGMGKREVGLVVYNAAYSCIAPFLATPLEDHVRELDVNVRAPMLLAHAFGTAMSERRRGGIVLVSSLAGFQGSALVANYAATKAYNTVLGEGLAEEFRGENVDVLVCCAGATRTPNYQRTAPQTKGVPVPLQEAHEVAEETLNALGRRALVVTGRANRWAAFLMQRLLPRRRAVSIISANTRKMYPKR